MKRLLITGGAGAIGRVMRKRLSGIADVIRLADVVALTPEHDGEECVQCDLADASAVRAMVADCDGILHLGGIPVERPFDEILHANIIGMYNLYEAARAHGHPRILFASSNHTVGFYPQTQRLRADEPLRPDGLYGVSKGYGELLARLYFDKFGQETASVRIGSCTREPVDYRMLSSWLSYEDFATLTERVLKVPVLGCPVIWGVSANPASWWDNSNVGWLGWQPKDSAENWRTAIEAQGIPPANHPLVTKQGGLFTELAIMRNERSV